MAALITILVLLASCSALVVCNQSSRFTFDRSTARMTTYITTESYVYHMEMDQHDGGNILFSDLSSLKTTDSKETKTVAGRATERGYRESAGEAARFSLITGFYQISSRKVVIADRNNHCLRLIDRLTTQTQAFSGTCTKSGYADGSQALFIYPHSIIPDSRDQDKLLVTDGYNNAVRHVDIHTGVVFTFFKLAHFFPAGITQDFSSGDLYMTTSDAVYHLHYQSKDLTLIAGSQYGYRDGDFSVSLLDYPRELLLIGNMRKLLVTDSYNHRLRLLDRQSNTTYSLCTGAYEHTDGDMNSCSLYFPYSLMVSGDSLYIGEYQSIRITSGSIATTPSTTQTTSLTTMPAAMPTTSPTTTPTTTPTTAPTTTPTATPPTTPTTSLDTNPTTIPTTAPTTTSTTTPMTTTKSPCTQGNITKKLQPEEKTVGVEILPGHSLQLPAGEYIYTFASQPDNCTIHITIMTGTHLKASDPMTMVAIFLPISVIIVGIVIAVGIILGKRRNAAKPEQRVSLPETPTESSDYYNMPGEPQTAGTLPGASIMLQIQTQGTIQSQYERLNFGARNHGQECFLPKKTLPAEHGEQLNLSGEDSNEEHVYASVSATKV